MRIFATIYPFIESAEESYRLGRHVANYEFFRELLRYGTFDEYHIFCMNVAHYRATAEKLRQEAIPVECKEKVRLFLYQHLFEQLQTQEYEVFHLGGWGYFFAGLVHLRNRYARVPFPVTGVIHSLNGQETPFHAMKVACAPLLPCDTIVCSSDAGRRVLEKSFGALEAVAAAGNGSGFRGKTAILPLGVSEDFATGSDRTECRQRLGLPRQGTMVLSVGRFSPQTKADLYPLLATVARLAREREDLFLVLAGGGSAGQVQLVRTMAAELGIEGKTVIVQNFDVSEKPLLYGAADIYVSISDNLQETFGISVVEAMASGIPVVVSDIDGYSELVEEGVQGYRIPTLWTGRLDMAELADLMNFDTMQLLLAQCMVVDTEAMLGVLRRLSGDSSLREVLGQKGRERVAQRYAWPIIIEQYEALWKQLKQEAVRGEGAMEARSNPFMHDYLQAFSHYPTGIVGGNHRCTVTVAGKETIEAGRLPTPYSDVEPLLDIPFAAAALKALASGAARSIGELTGTDGNAASGDRKLFTLLWMAKYGLVQIAAPGS
jgi:glycosyltransferase involved in cell wall biosynthesis